jgi:hypothetical protein
MALIIPHDHEIQQKCPILCLQKYTKIGIFGMKVHKNWHFWHENIPSGNSGFAVLLYFWQFIWMNCTLLVVPMTQTTSDSTLCT